MISEEGIRKLVEQKIGEGPLFLVDLNIAPGNKIRVELDGDKGISIDDCVEVSRYIENSLDRDTEDFELQVSSAGLDKPLRNRRQYVKNIGREVAIRLNDGTERVGIIEGVSEGVTLKLPASKKKKLPERRENIGWADIKETKVRITFK